MKWTERELAKSLHLHVFDGKHLVVCPNCNFTGHECDLLVVRHDLRLVDVEIKISRADLKADRHKEKWLKPIEWIDWKLGNKPREPRPYPAKIWKHYYAVPKEIWKDELYADIQPISGVLLIKDFGERPFLSIQRQAKPNKDAVPIDARDLCKIAKLTSDRMWAAYSEVDAHRRHVESERTAVSEEG